MHFVRTFFYNFLGILALSIVPFTAHAQTTGESYEPIVSLPGISSSIGAQDTIAEYVTGLFDIAIGLAIVLSVVVLVIAGIEYMGSGASQSARKDAKDRITNAILGLLIAFASVLLLNLINPNLTSLSIGGGSSGSGPGGSILGSRSSQGYIPEGGTGGGDLTEYCFTESSGDQSCYPTQNDCGAARDVLLYQGLVDSDAKCQPSGEASSGGATSGGSSGTINTSGGQSQNGESAQSPQYCLSYTGTAECFDAKQSCTSVRDQLVAQGVIGSETTCSNTSNSGNTSSANQEESYYVLTGVVENERGQVYTVSRQYNTQQECYESVRNFEQEESLTFREVRTGCEEQVSGSQQESVSSYCEFCSTQSGCITSFDPSSQAWAECKAKSKQLEREIAARRNNTSLLGGESFEAQTGSSLADSTEEGAVPTFREAAGVEPRQQSCPAVPSADELNGGKGCERMYCYSSGSYTQSGNTEDTYACYNTLRKCQDAVNAQECQIQGFSGSCRYWRDAGKEC